ncbi:hypothetical protein Clacol_006628 [Clathrus columnatus]|uniref:AB hydrolase-1 domain-containing protein n=1 Tax=Clathrus columnatus TaxID=1419009 RepID=A0AAV5AHE4_9AGAM|nr:hypothetical protein Clacol_006628 [Clathrus columnatus]
MVWSIFTSQPNTQLYFSPLPSLVRVKGGHSTNGMIGNDEPESEISLREFVITRCPSLSQGYMGPPWWLDNGHLQTLYSALGNFDHLDEIVYERRFLRLPDGGTLGLDFAGPQKISNDITIVLMLHGISGGSNEAYVRSVLRHVCAPKYEGGLGYRGVVMNFRGCGNVPLTSPQLYSAGYTDDLRATILYLRKKYPKAKILGIGFSLGANVLTRYLGEEGYNSQLVSGCALACPWDLLRFSDHIESSWFHRNIYSRALAQSIQAKVKENLNIMRQECSQDVLLHIDTLLKAKNPQVILVDEHVTRFLGGSSTPFPLASAKDYYRWASCIDQVSNIRVPFLAINALDDPISSTVPVPLPEEAAHTILATTANGGHLGWFEGGGVGWWETKRWIKNPIVEWVRATGEELVSQTLPDVAVMIKDGFTCLESKPEVGFKEIILEMVPITKDDLLPLSI